MLPADRVPVRRGEGVFARPAGSPLRSVRVHSAGVQASPFRNSSECLRQLPGKGLVSILQAFAGAPWNLAGGSGVMDGPTVNL